MANTENDEQSFVLSKRHPTWWFAELWDDIGRFALMIFITFSLIPFIGFLVIGLVEGTLQLSGSANGILEDLVFLSYFPVVFLGILGIRYTLERHYLTINSLWGRQLLQFRVDTKDMTDDPIRFTSSLTRSDVNELIQFCDLVLALITFRGAADIECPHNYKSLYRRLRRLWGLLILGGLVALGTGTYYHFYAIEIYGFDIWASSNYPIGFAARFVYEAVLYVIVIPVILIQLFVSIILVYQPLKLLNDKNGLQFRRFTFDEAGGLGQFGTQSLTNILSFTSFILTILTYMMTYPTTPFLIAGLALYVAAVPLGFLSQLWSAHLALLKAKERELTIIGKSFSNYYDLFKNQWVNANSIEELDHNRLIVHGEALEKADIEYSSIQQQSTWPFKKSQIGQVVSLMTILLTLIVSLL